MITKDIKASLNNLTTAHLADACVRVGEAVRCAPYTIKAIIPGMKCFGPAHPVQHFGSVDILLEALETALPGDVLVIDNLGRTDEACIGDLITLEVSHAQLNGVVVWGLHRDTLELKDIGLPVYSLGALPNGPLAMETRTAHALIQAQTGEHTITKADFVVAHDDGILFINQAALENVINVAETIRDTERQQANLLKQSGQNLRSQLQFKQYLTKRQQNPDYTFREHLRFLGNAIEE